MHDSEYEYVVTAIRPSKRAAGRYSVYINGRFVGSLTTEEIAEFRLEKGKRLSCSDFSSFSEQFEDRRLRDTAFRLLSYRSRTEKEMSERLRRKGFSLSKIDRLISEFRDRKMLCDREFAQSWVENRLRLRPRGSGLLIRELMAKGVPEDIARQVVGEAFSDSDEEDIAYQLADRHRQRFSRENSVDRKRKICNFLRYRGFSPDAILSAVDRLLADMDRETAE